MEDPLKDTMLIFAEGSSNGRAAYAADGKGYVVQTDPASAQIVQLPLDAIVFQLYAGKAFDLYRDSQYHF